MPGNGMVVTRSVYHRYLEKDVTYDNPFAHNVFSKLPEAIKRYRKYYKDEPDIEKDMGTVDIKFFSDGEAIGESDSSVRGKDVFLIHDFKGIYGQFQPNDGILAHVAAVDGLWRAGAEKIYALEPFFPYGRQERKDRPRRPITAKKVAEILSDKINTYVTTDMHTGALEGYFTCPVVSLRAMPLFVKRLQNIGGLWIPVSPDAGGVVRAREMKKLMGSPEIGVIFKETVEDNKKEALYLTGDVKGHDCVIIDDMFDTAGTLTEAAKKLKDSGAKMVYAACTHPLNSPFEEDTEGNYRRAAERIMDSEIDKVLFTDSISLGEEFLLDYGEKFEELSMASPYANVIVRLHTGSSVSKYLGDYYDLFKDTPDGD
jgi:ribose-phosphate pyrophosphokinase